MNKIYTYLLGTLLAISPLLVTGQISNITEVILTFTPTGGGTPIVATAQNNGTGLQVSGSIDLIESTDYELAITLGSNGSDLNPTIQQNATDYLFFFAFADDVMTSPAGDGNVDNRTDVINYNDSDAGGLPIGLSTNWTTECGEATISDTFQIVLKYQDGIKTATSTVNDGLTVLDLTWNINILNDPNAPPCENEEEIITDVTLTFTPVDGGTPIIARAQDPDGPGPLDLEILDDINLLESTEYTMTITVFNAIEGEDITEEIMEEDDEHMFFFAWTEGIFSDPTGDGNIDNRTDPVRYNDFDENGFPVGLSTNWTTSAVMTNGTFRVVLKHQPGVKSATSMVEDGGTDIDLTWNIGTVLTSANNIQVNTTDLRLSPNPVRNALQWRIDALPTSQADVMIVDQFGRVVSVNQNPQSVLDVSQLPKGIYTLQVRSEDTIWTQRFVKL